MHQGTLGMRWDLTTHKGDRIRSPRETSRQTELLSDLFIRKSAMQKLMLLKSNTGSKGTRDSKS